MQNMNKNRIGTIMVFFAALALLVPGCQSQSDLAPSSAQSQAGSPAVEAKATEAETATAANRVLLTVNGQELTGWQMATMLKYKVRRDEVGVAGMWTDIKLKAAEARRRGLDQTKESQFILELFKENFLAGMLDRSVAELVEPITTEQARKYYDENIKSFMRPLRIRVQHIMVADQELAETVAAEARQDGADFDKLVDRYSQAADKSRKGQTRDMVSGQMIRQFGKELAAVIEQAQAGDIVGPQAGQKGFEIIKILAKKPADITSFDKVEDRIKRQLGTEAGRKNHEKIIENLKADAEIDKSAELLELEKKAKAAKTKAKPARPLMRSDGP